MGAPASWGPEPVASAAPPGRAQVRGRRRRATSAGEPHAASDERAVWPDSGGQSSKEVEPTAKSKEVEPTVKLSELRTADELATTELRDRAVRRARHYRAV